MWGRGVRVAGGLVACGLVPGGISRPGLPPCLSFERAVPRPCRVPRIWPMHAWSLDAYITGSDLMVNYMYNALIATISSCWCKSDQKRCQHI